MRDKLAELEGQNRARTKATIAALEGKVSNLEEQLDQEAKLVFFFTWDGHNAGYVCVL